MASTNFNINNRQRLVFVNDTEINTTQQGKNLIALSENYPNIVFFTNESYSKDNNSDLDELWNTTNGESTPFNANNIIIGGSRFVRVRDVAPKKSSFIVNNQLITLRLNDTYGLLEFSTSPGIHSVQSMGVYYNYTSPTEEEGNSQYDDSSNVWYVWKNDQDSSLANKLENATNNTIMILYKIQAVMDSINYIQDAPELDLYYYTKNNNTYNRKYLNKDSIDESYCLGLVNKVKVFESEETDPSEQTGDKYKTSYFAYIYEIKNHIAINQSEYDNAKKGVFFEGYGLNPDLDSNNANGYYTGLICEQSNNIVFSPVFTTFGIITYSDKLNYNTWSRETQLSKNNIVDYETNEEVTNLTFDLSEITFNIVPNEKVYYQSYVNAQKNNNQLLSDIVTLNADLRNMELFKIVLIDKDHANAKYNVIVEYENNNEQDITTQFSFKIIGLHLTYTPSAYNGVLKTDYNKTELRKMPKYNYEIKLEYVDNTSVKENIYDTYGPILPITDLTMESYNISIYGNAYMFIISRYYTRADAQEALNIGIGRWELENEHYTTRSEINTSERGQIQITGGTANNYIITHNSIFNTTNYNMFIVEPNLKSFIDNCKQDNTNLNCQVPSFGITINQSELQILTSSYNPEYHAYLVNNGDGSGSVKNFSNEEMTMNCYIVEKNNN